MKKAITILAVLIVVVSAVFATLPNAADSETHTIQLKTVVQSVLPQFRLSATIATGFATGTGAATQAQTNPDGTGSSVSGTAVDFANNASYSQQIDVADISTTNIVANVTASLINAAKTGGKYTLSFDGGSFDNVWWYDSTNEVVHHGAAGDETALLSIRGAISDLTAGTAGTGHTPSVVEGQNKVEVVFNGQATETKALATFTVTYLQHPEAVDNNGVGYTADITMTVEFDG